MSVGVRDAGGGRTERALRLGWFFEPRLTRTRIDGAPDWLRSVKPLFVTDVHLRGGVSDARLEAFVGQLGAAEGNLLLLGGDYAESERDCARFFRALGRLRFPLGAFAVLGNNDRADRSELRAWMEGAGVTLLVNESRRIQLPGGTLEIGGCDEHKYGDPRTAGLFSRGEAYRVLLSHFPTPPECECELMLCGHTHGGQVCLAGWTPYSLGFEREVRAMAVAGLCRIGEMRLLVSRGVGASKLPLRLNAAPEIHLLEFAG